ncbi:MAG: hypothetical protein LBJ46_07435 [Planctomycetota bacterium]|jgi:hypothetical protein|nr:hypothetical protein [Planctomycetota bacterium]
MPTYVLNRSYTHRSRYGHAITFPKGEPTWVPPGPIELEVAALGADRVDGEQPDLVPQTAAPKAPASDDELEGLMREAFVELSAKNDPADFTASGVPTVKAVERTIGEDVTAKQVAEYWAKMKAEQG